MKLLAIETCTEACSAAVYVDGEVVERYQIAARQHNELILPMAEQVLAEVQISLSQLDGLAFGCGPGAFTGVRICVAVSQGIAFAHDLPLLGISSLVNLAAQAPATGQGEQQVFAAIDARMGEIYYGHYLVAPNSVPVLSGTEQVVTAEALNLELANFDYGMGSGWQSYAEPLMAKTAIKPMISFQNKYSHLKHAPKVSLLLRKRNEFAPVRLHFQKDIPPDQIHKHPHLASPCNQQR